ncbi:MAG: hypothetical protein IJF07_07460 [Lachnospiraceae bacterium]|nr:hypothetical protein [Lachnospiraceae bacterium]
MNIPKRQLITNGFFNKDYEEIRTVARRLAQCGVNEILLSVDAFHQETIPLEPVKEFAAEIKAQGVRLQTQPAWLVSKEHDNPFNLRTHELLAEFAIMGIAQADGNVIIPTGNAQKYLSEYYDMSIEYSSPYEENPSDIHAISIEPNGEVLGDNIYKKGILEILKQYAP